MTTSQYRANLAKAERIITSAMATCSQLKSDISASRARCDELIKRTDALIRQIEARDPHFFDRRRG